MIVYRRINYIALIILLWATGCSTAVARRPDLSATPPIPTLVEEQPTQTQLPTSKLQITYVQKTSTGFDGMYAVDITCQTESKLCLGDPELLFQTFSSASGDVNKPTGSISSYDWSPDGNKIVLSANEDIFIGNMKTQEWINITNSAELDESDPVWSSDGKYIYYLSCSSELGYGYCRLARIMPTGEDKIELLNLVDKSIDYFAVSPDGQYVVFSISVGGFYHLYRSNPDGSEIRPITTSELEEKYPALEEIYPSFSPDGDRVVFMRSYYSLPAGISKEIVDLIMRDVNLDLEKNLTEDFEYEVYFPVFSPEGKWIVFTAYDTALGGNVYVMSIDRNLIIQATKGNTVNTYPSWRLVRDP